MNKTGIYLVYYDNSDNYDQIYYDEGYYRNLENAIDAFKILVRKELKREAKIDLEEFDNFCHISEETEFGEMVVLCEIITED